VNLFLIKDFEMKIRSIWKLVMVGATVMLANPAYADVACTFTLSSVVIDYWGNSAITVTGSGSTYNWDVCNLQGTVSVNTGNGAVNFTSGACSALYSQLLTARASGSPIVLGFHGPTSCNSGLPASGWMSSPSPLFPTYFQF